MIKHKIHKLFGIPALFLWVFFPWAASGSELNLPEEFRGLLDSPPMIDYSSNGGSSLVYSLEGRGSVLIVGEDFFSFVSYFEAEDSDLVKYSFKTFSKRFGLEVEGKGELFEKYFKVSQGKPDEKRRDVTLIDRGSKVEMNLGLVRIKWSKGGFLYHNGKISFEDGDHDGKPDGTELGC